MLECQDLFISFGDRTVITGCSLSLAAGDRVALMGPSGCGKTTLLRIVLSLQKPDRGSIITSAQRIGAVFQEPRLLPWRTAAENVNLVLSDRPETMSEARAWLDRLELSDALDLYPAELSGGMQQRVSIARALSISPDLLVLDEPFKGLDAELHDRVLETVCTSLSGAALLLATHSEEEAEALNCRILRYHDGRFV